jgi:uncharacterized Ntn-hydrolase superfamily protein
MTCTILARCGDTGQLGVGVVSSLMAVTGRCAFVQAQVGAVAVQSMADPRLGPAALELLAGGYRPEAVLRAFDRTEEGFEYRQVALVNARGDTAVHTGRKAAGVCNGAQGQGCAALGNRLVDPAVPDRMVAALKRAGGELGDRLMAALRTAVADGGAGPVRAAGLLVAEREPWPLADLRVDWTDGGDPVAELDRLWRLWRPQMRDYLDRALDPAAAAGAAGG